MLSNYQSSLQKITVFYNKKEGLKGALQLLIMPLPLSAILLELYRNSFLLLSCIIYFQFSQKSQQHMNEANGIVGKMFSNNS